MLFLALTFILLASSEAIQLPVYKSFKTHLTGLRNASYRFHLKQGLTARDKQAILDMHNLLRAYIAAGNETRGYNIKRQPPGANIQALSWDDYLADFAQAWADTGAMKHNPKTFEDPRFKNVNGAENMSGDMFFIEDDMYGEVQYWNYDTYSCDRTKQCGHYLAFVNAYWVYVGCGWKSPNLVCNFVGLSTTAIEDGAKRLPYQHEYLKGPPCSFCEQGFDFCMSGGLCATKAQCDSDPLNSCRCLNDQSECTANGGVFDHINCRCKCPSNRYGVNCKRECTNIPDHCGMDCSPHDVGEALFCNKACNGCGKSISNIYKFWYVDRPPKNRDNIKTRAVWPTPLVTPPSLGNCKNKVSDSVCAMIAERNYCLDNEYKGICSRQCNTCGFVDPDQKPVPDVVDLGVEGMDFSNLNLTGFKVTSETESGDKPAGNTTGNDADIMAQLKLAGFKVTGETESDNTGNNKRAENTGDNDADANNY